MGAWIVVQKQVVAFEVVDANAHEQDVAGHARRENFMALDSAILVRGACRTPIFLKSVEWISGVLLGVLRPIRILSPNAVRLLQVVLLDG